jgi:GNAT superfamily N-acetyltransferase
LEEHGRFLSHLKPVSSKHLRSYAPQGLRVLQGPYEKIDKGSIWKLVDESGYAQVTFLHDSEALYVDTLYIEDMEVKPEARGMGHGRSLYLKIEEMARNIGAKWIQIDANDSAVGFWLKLDFIATGLAMYRGKVSMVKKVPECRDRVS